MGLKNETSHVKVLAYTAMIKMASLTFGRSHMQYNIIF